MGCDRKGIRHKNGDYGGRVDGYFLGSLGNPAEIAPLTQLQQQNPETWQDNFGSCGWIGIKFSPLIGRELRTNWMDFEYRFSWRQVPGGMLIAGLVFNNSFKHI